MSEKNTDNRPVALCISGVKKMYKLGQIGGGTLVTTSSVARSEFLYFLARVRQFSQSRFFIATVVAAVVLSIVYVLLKAHWREKHIRSRMNRR